MNIALIQGRPCRDPEIKKSEKGTVYVRARIAVDGTYRGKDVPRKSSFFTVVFFGKLAQRYYNSVAKGALLTILGRLEQREYIDNVGNKREEVSIIAEKLTVHEALRKNKPLDLGSFDELVPREITDSLFKQIDYDDEDIPGEDGDLVDPLQI